MKSTVLCTLPQEEVEYLQDLVWKKNAVDDLSIVIAEQNHILREESDLYQRILADKVDCEKKLKAFWDAYLKKFRDELTEGEQLFVDFEAFELLKMPRAGSCHKTMKTTQ